MISIGAIHIFQTGGSYLDERMFLSHWLHLVLHTRPCMSINPRKMHLHLIFTVRMVVMGPKWKLWWDPNENAIPWCICRGSGPVHSLCLCLLGLRSYAWRKKVQEIWNNQSSDLFLFIIRQTNKNRPPVHFGPKRSSRVPLTSVLPRFWSFCVWWSPDHLGSGLNSLTYSSTLQAHLTPSMTHEPCKHSLPHQWS